MSWNNIRRGPHYVKACKEIKKNQKGVDLYRIVLQSPVLKDVKGLFQLTSLSQRNFQRKQGILSIEGTRVKCVVWLSWIESGTKVGWKDCLEEWHLL